MSKFYSEENYNGNIFMEIKRDPEIAHFLIETTYMAFISAKAIDLTEPFPSFLLKDRELRSKRGIIDKIN